MLAAFLIMLREGIEAALIVGIIAGFLRQAGYLHLMNKVWLGVMLASALCLGLGVWIHHETGEIPQRQQEFVAGILGFVAAIMLTTMILWMKKASKTLKADLHKSLSDILHRGESYGWALVVTAFLAVAREGMESVFFLLAVFKQSQGFTLPVGAVLGLLAAIILGYLIYKGGVKINLAKFFRVTGVLLIFIAAGLLAGAFRTLHEAGVWNIGQTIIANFSHILSEDGVVGVLLAGFFGYTDHPTISDAIIYLAYLIPVLWFFLHTGSRTAVYSVSTKN